MRRRVPLNAIRAFEAAARNASVVKAADELCVTPTAVSHQIRILEEFLQVELFKRRNNRIVMTDEAAANIARLTRALDLIDEAVVAFADARPATRYSTLSVATSASVASLWLVPKISHFLAIEPDVELDLSTFVSRAEAEARECDVRICNWKSDLDCRIEPLLEEEIFPVCAPALAARFGNDRREILSRAPLVHVDRRMTGFEPNQPDWQQYLGDCGMSRAQVMHGPRFNQASTAIDAARAGVGVILGRSLLVAQALASGDLVQVGEAHPRRSPYYLMTPHRPSNAPLLQSFRDWLLSLAPELPGTVAA
ncbi:LysR substrate-binding domain-containing protein [Frigidibacter sp. MR17.14]|uniref:LysR substrate-binding domain-containing protein n=1 Tax=Frigidibacter sp. MR17.14 TaxID=3126509 RepID=UPI003012A0E3